MDWIIGFWGRSGSNSEKVAIHISNRAKIPIADFFGNPHLPVPENLIIVTSNLGDEEVPEDLERFLVRRGKEIRNWTIVEIGNYYGFDDFNFGAGNRIALHLSATRTANQALTGVGIDSLPHIDYRTLDSWCNEILLREPTNAI